MEYFQYLQYYGACIGWAISLITLISLIVKPIRVKIINRIKGISKTDLTQETLMRIENNLQQQKKQLDEIAEGTQANLRNNILQLVDKSIAKGYITGLERANLKDMYKAYHRLGGDTYATDRYELALELPQKE